MNAGAASPRLLMGRIGAAHGVRGEVRITSFTEDPLAIAKYGTLATNRAGLSIQIVAVRAASKGVVARLKGVSDRNAAEALNGVELYADRSVLPPADDPDDFYHADLVGLEARLGDGAVLGTVSAVLNFGAGDLIEVRGAKGGESFLYPFSRAVVPEVQVAGGYLVIEPPVETEAEPGDEDKA